MLNSKKMLFKYGSFFGVGDVLKVHYMVFLKNKKKKKRTYSFVGLCLSTKRKCFKLLNNVKKEKIFMLFDLNSPIIFKIVLLKIYKKIVVRISKIYFKQNISYFDDYKNKENTLSSNISRFSFDFFFSAYLKKKLMRVRKKRKKFKRKYSYTESWKTLKKVIQNFGDFLKKNDSYF